MNIHEQQQIEAACDQLQQDIRLRLVKTQDRRTQRFEDFCRFLNQFAPRISFVCETDDSDRLPELWVHPRIRYQALPMGQECAPFLESLSWISGQKKPQTPSPVQSLLDQLSLPVELTLYISEQCPFCPAVVRSLISLALASPWIQLAVIEADLFTEQAQKNQILSVPTLLLDRQFRWTGNIPLQEVVDAAVHRDPSRFQPDTLISMIEEGNAGLLAKMMIDRGVIFPALFDLVAHPKWPVRLGAMVTVETLAEEKPDLVRQLTDGLWDRFDAADDQAKGDILYLIGEIDDGASCEKIKEVLKGNYQFEIREAAEEALEKIRG